VISKFVKTAKYLSGWLDWTLMYPLWRTEVGREQIVRYLVQLARKHPKEFEQVQRLIGKIMAETLLKSAATRVKQAAATTPAAKPETKTPEAKPKPAYREPYHRRGDDLYDAGGERIPHPTELPEDKSGDDPLFGKKPAEGLRIVDEAKPAKRRDIGELKSRLGLKKV
jgi:hypothetical protein